MNKRQDKIKGIFNLESFPANQEFDPNFSTNDSSFEYDNLINGVKAKTSMKLNVYAINNILFIDDVEFVISYNDRLDIYSLLYCSEEIYVKRS